MQRLLSKAVPKNPGAIQGFLDDRPGIEKKIQTHITCMESVLERHSLLDMKITADVLSWDEGEALHLEARIRKDAETVAEINWELAMELAAQDSLSGSCDLSSGFLPA